MATLDRRSEWWKAALLLVLGTTILSLIGCQGDPRPSETTAGDLASPASGTDEVALPPEGNAGLAPTVGCDEDGATEECSNYLGEYEGVLSCYLGMKTCSGGVWGECESGDVVNLSAASILGGSSGFLSLSAPEECLGNPCDPNCWGYPESPGEALRPASARVAVVWPGGSLSEYPGGLVDKGLKEPCQWGPDCQFNRRCQQPVTGSGCTHSKCMPGLPLGSSCDPCVTAVCAAEPSCCDTTVAAANYTNTCTHTPCTTGAQLKSNCHSCAAKVCAADPRCCEGGGTWQAQQVQVCTGNGWRRVCNWVTQQVWVAGTWNAACVNLVANECGLLCPWGSGTTTLQQPAGAWTQSCVDKVDTVCGAECGEPVASTCVHDVCTAGAALDAKCHSCATKVCAKDPLCCITGWSASCVARVPQECGRTCPIPMLNPPPEHGSCVAWLPSQQRESCNGIDLGGGIVCGDTVPVCNHGTQVAPAGIRLIHFPGNSKQFPEAAPEQTSPQMQQCFTSEPVRPGECVGVTTCTGLNGNREIMINPPDPAGTAAAARRHVDECQMNDNWTLSSNNMSCVEPQCSGGDSETVIRRVNLMIMMDKSGSMAGTKWNGATAAIKGFASSPDSAGLRLALEFFALTSGGTRGDGCAGNNSCSATPCSNPMVPLGVLLKETGTTDPQERAIINAVNATAPEGMTPMYPAVQGALNWAIAGKTANVEDVYAVVLVTDGEPTACETRTEYIARLSYDAYTSKGIKTYTVGMEGASITALNTMANAGGTGSAFVISSTGDVAAQLTQVFQSIARENAQCVFTLENADAIDPEDGSVNFYSSVSGGTEPLPKLSGPEECGNGWYFDDPRDPTTVSLCSDTCEVVQTDDRARIDLGFGCAKPFTTTERSEYYEGLCDAAQGPQWGYLSYDTTIVDDSHILLQVRTAPDQASLASAPFVTVADIGGGGPDPEDCSMFGPAPCPIALYPALGGMPSARYDALELKITMDPASDQYQGPSLNDWEITYSCGYNE